jgi:hypothetical protein
MTETNNKEEQEMKKVTFATLKSIANKGLLQHRVRAEHGAYGMEFYADQPVVTTKVEDLKRFKATKNYITTENCHEFINGPFGSVESDAQLDNCIFSVVFFFATEKTKK